jgi:hypothetical protein
LLKKHNQTAFFKKKTETETGSNRPVSVRFGFLEQKSVQTGFGSVFSVWLGFGSVFFDLGSIRFFRFQTYKTKTKPVSFF